MFCFLLNICYSDWYKKVTRLLKWKVWKLDVYSLFLQTFFTKHHTVIMSASSNSTLAVAIDSTAAHATQPAVMDEDYFMDTSFVVFRGCGFTSYLLTDVDVSYLGWKLLFRVPRYQLVKGSETFADPFQLFQREGSTEGSTAENPIVLPVSHVDFRNFLTLVYPR